MSYVELRTAFDERASDLFANSYTLHQAEKITRIQELYALALQVLPAAEGRDDADKIAATVATILHRAYSISSTLEQSEILRKRLNGSQASVGAMSI
ncbi:hypothetical protein D3C81_315420 [compost metagenome]